MEQRKLGALQVPALGLGCMVMPAFYTPGSIEDSIATLHRAAEIGVTLIEKGDTPATVLARADKAMYRVKAAA